MISSKHEIMLFYFPDTLPTLLFHPANGLVQIDIDGLWMLEIDSAGIRRAYFHGDGMWSGKLEVGRHNEADGIVHIAHAAIGHTVNLRIEMPRGVTARANRR